MSCGRYMSSVLRSIMSIINPFVCYGHGALLVGAGKPLLARHRAVNAAIADEIKKIHAITLKTYTPQQWEDIKAKASA